MIIDMTKKEGINMSTEKINVAKIFGENVFNDTVMQERLPKKVYIKLKKTIEEGRELDLETADVIAHEMKEWAIEKGATHYTHWFLPLTGVTAEKHDSFISALLYLRTAAERQGADELFRKGTDQGRTGCFFIPVRRIEGHIRGERLHDVGLYFTGVREKRCGGRDPLHPDGVLFLHGRGAGSEDAAPAFHGSDQYSGAEAPETLWKYNI